MLQFLRFKGERIFKESKYSIESRVTSSNEVSKKTRKENSFFHHFSLSLFKLVIVVVVVVVVAVDVVVDVVVVVVVDVVVDVVVAPNVSHSF